MTKFEPTRKTKNGGHWLQTYTRTSASLNCITCKFRVSKLSRRWTEFMLSLGQCLVGARCLPLHKLENLVGSPSPNHVCSENLQGDGSASPVLYLCQSMKPTFLTRPAHPPRDLACGHTWAQSQLLADKSSAQPNIYQISPAWPEHRTSSSPFFQTDEAAQEQCLINLDLFPFNLLLSDLYSYHWERENT